MVVNRLLGYFTENKMPKKLIFIKDFKVCFRVIYFLECFMKMFDDLYHFLKYRVYHLEHLEKWLWIKMYEVFGQLSLLIR